MEFARKRVALLAGVRPGEAAWASDATEASNLAIRGTLLAAPKRPRHLVTLSTEHLAVLDTARAMRKEGFAVEVLPVNRKSMADLDRLRSLVRAASSLVSVMWVNNETGVVQPIAEIAGICKEAGALLHVDAAQAAGKIDVDTRRIPVDLMPLSAHKTYGPEGVGALVVRRGVTLKPLASGGGQERGLRPGTLPTPLAIGMGKAFELMAKERAGLQRKIADWHDRIARLVGKLGDAKVNGDPACKVPHILNASFAGIGGELIASMPGVAVSNSSACTTQKVKASHVLMAMGLTKPQALGSVPRPLTANHRRAGPGRRSRPSMSIARECPAPTSPLPRPGSIRAPPARPQQSLSQTGISIEVRREPADGYWPNVWMAEPWTASCHNGSRPPTGCSDRGTAPPPGGT